MKKKKLLGIKKNMNTNPKRRSSRVLREDQEVPKQSPQVVENCQIYQVNQKMYNPVQVVIQREEHLPNKQ